MPLPRLISFPDLPWRKNSPWSIAGSQGLVLETSSWVGCLPVCVWSSILLLTWPLNKCNLFVWSTFIHVNPDVPFQTIFLLPIDWCSQNPSPRRCPQGWPAERCRMRVSREGESTPEPKGHLSEVVSCLEREYLKWFAPADCCCSLFPRMRTKQLCLEAETRGRSRLCVFSLPVGAHLIGNLLCSSVVSPAPTLSLSLAQVLSSQGHLMLQSDSQASAWTCGLQSALQVLPSFSSICKYSWDSVPLLFAEGKKNKREGGSSKLSAKL